MRAERVARGIRTPITGVLGRWHAEVMALEALDPAIVEAVRLRAARHHDCRT